MLAPRHVDEIAPRQGHLRSDARPLRADGLLRHLHEDLLALPDQALDGGVALNASLLLRSFGVFVGEIRDVEKGGLFATDIDEGRLDSRQASAIKEPNPG